MKNRRTVIVAFMLVAAMVMGIGYAAVSGQLTIAGTASYYNPDKATVSGMLNFSKITENLEGANYDTSRVTITGVGTQAATLAVVLNQDDAVDGKITVKVDFTIKYDTSSLDEGTVVPNAVVSAPTINNSSILEVTTDFATKAGGASYTFTGDGELMFTVTMVLDTNSTAIDADPAQDGIQLPANGTYEFNIALNYEFVAK